MELMPHTLKDICGAIHKYPNAGKVKHNDVVDVIVLPSYEHAGGAVEPGPAICGRVVLRPIVLRHPALQHLQPSAAPTTLRSNLFREWTKSASSSYAGDDKIKMH